VLKKLPKKAIVLAYTHISCAIYFILIYYPTAWKQANVIPILKPSKDPSDPKGYRPISLLDAIVLVPKGFLIIKI
jgi:hypothetical protein